MVWAIALRRHPDDDVVTLAVELFRNMLRRRARAALSLAVLYPAWRASRLIPVDALRAD